MAQGRGCVYSCILAIAAVVVLALIVLVVIEYKHPTPPRYYASIDSVSGIGDHWGRRPLQFALNLGVESRSPLWGRACLERGTAVEVSYHGVALGFGASGREVCAGPWELWTVQKTNWFMARRSNVTGLPEFVVEGLVDDAWRGVQVFDVGFRVPSTEQYGAPGDKDDGKLVSCMARLAGDSSMANACDVHYS